MRVEGVGVRFTIRPYQNSLLLHFCTHRQVDIPRLCHFPVATEAMPSRLLVLAAHKSSVFPVDASYRIGSHWVSMTLGSTRSRHYCWPDYDGLIHVITYLHRPLDQFGETIPSAREARQIRACGFEARAGCKWRCPLLPELLVRGNPLLEFLSEDLDAFWHPRGWSRERARPLHRRYQPPTLTAIEARILNMLRRAPLGQLAKRALQQRLWRFPTSFLNYALKSLALKGYIQWTGPLICTSGISQQG